MKTTDSGGERKQAFSRFPLLLIRVSSVFNPWLSFRIMSTTLTPGQTLSDALTAHVESVRACTLCPKMRPPGVPGYPIASPVMLVGQAPGRHEPVLGRPFAWTAGRTLFSWFLEGCGVAEEQFRQRIYMTAVCRCFPGPLSAGGDRVPDRTEISTCSRWLRAEFHLLKPSLVIPVGRLAIIQFLPPAPLAALIGKQFRASYVGEEFDVIPLPHPSGASPWPRIEPGKTLLHQAMELIHAHPAMQQAISPG